jgi:predicted aconitase
MITDPRGVDLNHYRPLGQTEDMAMIERRFIAACEAVGIMMTNTCVNYQTYHAASCLAITLPMAILAL